jgi:polyisoprenoid-binding protein YceI
VNQRSKGTLATGTTVTIPTGTWTLDPVHSHVGFGLDHLGTSTFRCSFTEYAVTLRDGVLEGSVNAASIAISLEDFKTHVLASDFFDVERTPTFDFRSSSLDVDADGSLTVEGELTIKGNTHPVTAHGRFAGPLEGLNGRPRVGIELEATIDRFDYGINWNMQLPDGRRVAGADVTIQIAVELVEQR